MRIETEEHGAHVVIRPKGTFALGEATQALAETLTRAETEKSGAILVDLADLKSLDSTALGLLVGSLRRMHALSRQVILVHPNDRVRLLLSMTQLDSVFPIHSGVDEAFDDLERKTGGVTDRDRRRRDSV
jgi:anti-sigma B factor antagonist